MDKELLKKIADLGEKIGHVFVVTADASGVPHLAVARELTSPAKGRVAVKAWFCQGTVSNIQENPQINLSVWDPKMDIGYQLIGEIENVEELALLDGYIPKLAELPLPQSERRLIIRVDKVVAFSQKAHYDQEI